MPNERLRAAPRQKRITIAALTEDGVDPKTVERWVARDRQPYQRTGPAMTSRLGTDETAYSPDDKLNPHVYGVPANHAPLWHMRRIPDGEIVSTYRESFEHVWEDAEPLAPRA
ncbi:hypothetical protein AB0L06_30680 [Spirillospora sp. NPDC052269]